jgi:hypothetical protein
MSSEGIDLSKNLILKIFFFKDQTNFNEITRESNTNTAINTKKMMMIT